jgi:ABC-type oligopeptide transport system substrate-binding subunit
VLLDSEPQAIALDADVWGARLARLTGDPVLPCETGGPAAATVDAVTPDHLYLRPREGTSTRDLAAALETARHQRRPAELDDVDRLETGQSVVRLYLRRPSVRLAPALCDVVVPGTGPFKLAGSLGHGRPFTLARARGEGAPRLVVSVDTDPARALGRLRHGEADLLARLPEAYWPEQAQAPATARAFTALATPKNRLSYIVWNVRRAALAELDVRVALSETLDRQRLARELHRGLAVAAEPGPAFDRPDAVVRLERAGWIDRGGVRTREGRILRLTLLASPGSHATRLVTAWRETLRKLGVELELSTADGGAFAARLREGSFDAALVERLTPPERDLSPILGSRGSENFGGLHAQPVDAALGAWRTGSMELAAVWEAALTEAALVPLFRRGEVALLSRALEGVRPSGDWLDLTAAHWRVEAP